MGINRTRRLFGRQKKDAGVASQCTLYDFRPKSCHFLSPLFSFLVRGQRNYTSGVLIDMLLTPKHAGTFQKHSHLGF